MHVLDSATVRAAKVPVDMELLQVDSSCSAALDVPVSGLTFISKICDFSPRHTGMFFFRYDGVCFLSSSIS